MVENVGFQHHSLRHRRRTAPFSFAIAGETVDSHRDVHPASCTGAIARRQLHSPSSASFATCCTIRARYTSLRVVRWAIAPALLLRSDNDAPVPQDLGLVQQRLEFGNAGFGLTRPPACLGAPNRGIGHLHGVRRSI
jgi:hypothetical protein